MLSGEAKQINLPEDCVVIEVNTNINSTKGSIPSRRSTAKRALVRLTSPHLTDLAAERAISHRALSEHLRRTHHGGIGPSFVGETGRGSDEQHKYPGRPVRGDGPDETTSCGNSVENRLV